MGITNKRLIKIQHSLLDALSRSLSCEIFTPQYVTLPRRLDSPYQGREGVTARGSLLCINKRAGVCRCTEEEASDVSYSVDYV